MPRRIKQPVLALALLLLPLIATAQQSNGSLSPTSIDWPTYTQHGFELTIPVTVSNTGDAALNATVSVVQLGGPPGWLSVDQSSLSIPAMDQTTLNVTYNTGGMINNPGTRVSLEGWVLLAVEAPTATDSLGLYVRMFVVDTIVLPMWDTVSTSCLSLSAANTGNLGQNGVGGANMNFAADCDDSDTIPGDASIYLYDASPVIFNSGGQGSWSMYSHRSMFKPVESYIAPTTFDTNGFSAYYGGQAVNADSAIMIESWLFAPAAFDSCDFMIQATRIYASAGDPQNNLTIGFLADWNIPSDSFNWNGFAEDVSGTYAYQQGLEFDQDNAVECQENSARFGGIKPLGFRDGTTSGLSTAFDYHFAAPVVDSLLLPDGDLDETKVLDLLNGGTVGTGPSTNLMTVARYFQSYSCAFGDTLDIFTALATVENGTTTDLEAAFSKAENWLASRPNLLNYPAPPRDTCCTLRGDVNNDGVVNLSDLTCLLSPIFLNIWPNPCRSGCHWEANADVNADGRINLTDLTQLVNFLFVTFVPLVPCY